jgi:hypothetical protein
VPGFERNQPTEAQQVDPLPARTTDLVCRVDGLPAGPDTGTRAANVPALGPVADAAARYGVDEEVAAFLDQAAARIKHRGAKLVLLVVETGHDLLDAKRLLIVRGEFKRWVESEFDFTFRTAESWMNAALFADEHPDLVDKLHATMLYKLAAPKIPEVVKERLIAEIRAKKPPRTIKEVERLIEEAKKSEKATTVIEGDEAAFEFSDDREFDELAAELAESARASQELQSLLLQHVPSELISDVAQLLTAMRIGDIQKLASRLSANQSLTNPFDEGTRPSA